MALAERGAVVSESGDHGTEVLDGSHPGKNSGIGAHDGLHQLLFVSHFRNDPFATSMKLVHVRVFFVGFNAARQEILARLGIMRLDPLADSQGGFPHHILPGRIPGGEIQAQVQHVGHGEFLYMLQFSHSGGASRSSLKLLCQKTEQWRRVGPLAAPPVFAA